MDRLPHEIILEITSHLIVDGDDHKCIPVCPCITPLNNLLQCSRVLSQILRPLLYAHDAIYAGRAIFHGARTGAMDLINYSLSFGGDVNRKSPLQLPGYRETAFSAPLHVAVNEGRLDMVKHLFSHGANLDLGGWNICECQHNDLPYCPAPPWTALHLAVCRNHTDIAEYLVNHGARLITSREPSNPQNGRRRVLQMGRGVHVLDQAAQHANLRMCRFILDHHSDDLKLDEYPAGALRSLHRATRITDDEERLEVMRMLLDHGSRLRPMGEGSHLRKYFLNLPFDDAFISWVQRYDDGRNLGTIHPPGTSSPNTQLLAFLRYMSADGRPYLTPLRERVLEIWLDRGPGRLDGGWAMLYEALGAFGAAAPDPDVVRRWVLRELREPRLQLATADAMGVAGALRFMGKLGVPVSALEPLDELLLVASGSGMAAECAWLVEQGAALTAVDREGRTPLHIAAREGEPEVVRVLVELGADLRSLDGMGRTAREVVAGFYTRQVFALLDAAAVRGEGGVVGGPEEKMERCVVAA